MLRLTLFIAVFFLVWATPSAAAGTDFRDSAQVTSFADDAPGGRDVSPALETVPLLAFGLTSLAVGGVIYGIGATSQNRPTLSFAGRPTDWSLALGMAGASALAAGWAYFHYARREHEARVQAAVWAFPTDGGGAAFAALLRWRFDSGG